jgi:glucosamine-6-phosphate deaminase
LRRALRRFVEARLEVLHLGPGLVHHSRAAPLAGPRALSTPPTFAGRVPVSVFATPEIAGNFAADEVLMRLDRARRARGLMTLGCPGGRSLRTTYAALARLAAVRRLDLRDLHILMMDEYIERDGEAFRLCPADAHYSCRRFGDVEIRQALSAGLAPQLRIPIEHLHVPDPNAPDDYEALIEHLGGVDVFLLASGQTDGHVAFNPQGSTLAQRTRVIELAQATRRDNLGTFPDFRNLSEVPRYGVSVGPGTIASHSRSALMMLLGAAKGTALQRVTSTSTYDPDWPASVVVECADAQIVTDDAAVAGMVRRPQG